VTSGSGYLASVKYNKIIQELRIALYSKFINKDSYDTSIRHVDVLLMCGLSQQMNDIEYIFCNCFNPSIASNRPVRLSSLDQLYNKSEEELRKMNICNGIKNFTGVSNMALEVGSDVVTTKLGEDIASFKTALISTSLRNEFLKDALGSTWDSKIDGFPDKIVEITKKDNNTVFKRTQTPKNLPGGEDKNRFDSNVNNIVYNNYKLSNQHTTLARPAIISDLTNCRDYMHDKMKGKDSNLKLLPPGTYGSPGIGQSAPPGASIQSPHDQSSNQNTTSTTSTPLNITKGNTTKQNSENLEKIKKLCDTNTTDLTNTLEGTSIPSSEILTEITEGNTEYYKTQMSAQKLHQHIKKKLT